MVQNSSMSDMRVAKSWRYALNVNDHCVHLSFFFQQLGDRKSVV